MASIRSHGIFVALWLALSPVCVLAASSDTQTGPDSIEWRTNLPEAIKMANDSGRYVLANFYTDWCKWCKIQDESTFTDKRVIAMTGKFYFVRLNAEIDTAKAREFGVNGYPTVVVLDKNGLELDRILGYEKPADFVKTVDNYLKGIGTKNALEAEIRTKPKDLKLKYEVGEKYVGRGDFAQARASFQQVLSSDPNNASGLNDKAAVEMAMLLRKEKNWYKAIEGFRRFIKDYPNSDLREDAETYIPWLYSKAGDKPAALKYYRAFLKAFSGSSQAGWVKEQIKLLEKPADSTSTPDGTPLDRPRG
jgi:tetratricopeptide (TPR) repeat protein